MVAHVDSTQEGDTEKKINPENWLQKELWHKIPKSGILSLTKVKPTVGSWHHCFEQVSRNIFFTSFFFFLFFGGGGFIILSLLECIIFLLPYSMFSTSITLWELLVFLFLRNIDTLFFQVTKISFPSAFFISFILILFSVPFPGLTVKTR